MDEQPPAEQPEEQPRRVQKSEPGRLFWQPTQPHPLDILPEDVETLDALVPECVEQLTTQAATLQRLLSDLVAQDWKVSLQTRDEQALTAIHQRFGVRKHLEHFQHNFAWLRRQHFLGLIRVITATLALATQLLQERADFSRPQTPVLLRPQKRRFQNH